MPSSSGVQLPHHYVLPFTASSPVSNKSLSCCPGISSLSPIINPNYPTQSTKMEESVKVGNEDLLHSHEIAQLGSVIETVLSVTEGLINSLDMKTQVSVLPDESPVLQQFSSPEPDSLSIPLGEIASLPNQSSKDTQDPQTLENICNSALDSCHSSPDSLTSSAGAFVGFNPVSDGSDGVSSRRERLLAARRRLSFSPVRKQLEEARELLDDYRRRSRDRAHCIRRPNMPEVCQIPTPVRAPLLVESTPEYLGPHTRSRGPVDTIDRALGSTVEFKRRFPK